MKKLSLADWGHIAEIFGAVAVVVTLAYVGLQLQQNTAAIQAQNGPHTALAEVTVKSITCPGDANHDGAINVTDLLQMLASWGEVGGPLDLVDPPGVGVEDLEHLFLNWGPCNA